MNEDLDALPDEVDGITDPSDALAESTLSEPEAPAAAPADARYAAMEAQVGSLKDSIAQITNLMLAQAQGRAPEKAAPPVVEEVAPDLLKDPADTFVRYHARKALGGEFAELKAQIAALQEALAPVTSRERFVTEYHRAASDAKVSPKDFASKVAELIDSVPDLQEIAASDPARAARLALRMAQSTAPAAVAAPVVRRTPQPRPSPAVTPGSVSSRAASSWGEAIEQSLRERGVPVGSDIRFTMNGTPDLH